VKYSKNKIKFLPVVPNRPGAPLPPFPPTQPGSPGKPGPPATPLPTPLAPFVPGQAESAIAVQHPRTIAKIVINLNIFGNGRNMTNSFCQQVIYITSFCHGHFSFVFVIVLFHDRFQKIEVNFSKPRQAGGRTQIEIKMRIVNKINKFYNFVVGSLMIYEFLHIINIVLIMLYFRTSS